MRKVGAGLGSLAIALGLATTFALSAGAAPPEGADARPVAGRSSTSCRTRRGEAAGAAGGRAQAGASRAAPRSQRGNGQQGRQGRQDGRAAGRAGRGPVRRARAREDGQDLRRAGRVRRRARTRATRTRTRPDHPGAGDVQRAAAQQDPGARPHEGQLDGLAAGLRPRALPAAVLRHRRRRRVAQDVLRAPVVGPLQRRRPGHRLGQGPLQRGALRAQQRLPVREQRLREHVGR